MSSETVKEAAKKYAETHFADSTGALKGMASEIFLAGAAWQRERDAEIAETHLCKTCGVSHDMDGRLKSEIAEAIRTQQSEKRSQTGE